MKVSNDANNSIQGLQTTKAGGAQKKDKIEKGGKESVLSSPESRGASAKVDLSDRVQEMKKIKELAMQAPDVNAEKVKRFQELIDKGAYKADSKKIAEKLVEEHMHAAAASDE